VAVTRPERIGTSQDQGKHTMPQVARRPDAWTNGERVYTLYGMGSLRFEWDARKDAANQRKHGVSFKEASTVFADEDALLIADPDHSDEEERFVLLGLSSELRALVVCHCYREADETVRIVSARRANKREERQYADRRA
jgi:uncharacterized DUF497 family protein